MRRDAHALPFRLAHTLVPLLVASAGCQYVSGLDDLESGAGGATGGTSGATTSVTAASTNSSGPSTGPTTTSTGMCNDVPGGPCLPGNQMGCTGAADGCVGTECQVTCNGTTDDPGCNIGGGIGCGPPGSTYDCKILCTASGCGSKTIACNNGMGATCTVRCEGAGACDGTTIQCGTDGCNLECVDGGCTPSTELLCGAGPCNVACMNNPQAPMVTGPSCALDNGCLRAL